MINRRKVALDALIEVGENYGYSNLVLQKQFEKHRVENIDKPFITALFYGVLDRKITLEYVISQFSKGSINKIKPITLYALRLAVYQILYMDKVPDSAAVNESVKLVKFSKEKYNAAFVNGVLRSLLREGINFPKPDSPEALEIIYSCPKWIIESFIADYGYQNAVLILKHSLDVPEIVLRINTLKVSDEELIEKLVSSGFSVKPCDVAHAAVLDIGNDVKQLPGYAEGLFHIQDLPSQIAINKLGVLPDDSVIDLCAAPGGKSFTAAQYANNSDDLLACDVFEHRVQLIKSGAKRLGINSLKCIVHNSAVFDSGLGEFDKVICDVPCSGLGVIRRKPEIKYKVDLDLNELSATQISVLNNGLKYLKSGGKLLYSTCTLRKAENEDIVRACLKNLTDYDLDYEYTFLPGNTKTDGFYFAIIKRR